ncbi:outer membrane protein assembly factor BamA [Candidatus Babeliales bacterium]|nr:outer membrane protein assembly factor BamA [Candidatus Babeliales bacterium]
MLYKKSFIKRQFSAVFLFLVSCTSLHDIYADSLNIRSTSSSAQESFPLIKKIIIKGTNSVDEAVIKNRLPYEVNKPFNPTFSTEAINQLYNLGIFSQITVSEEKVGSNECNLIITLEEYALVDDFLFKGVNHFEKEKLLEKLHLSENDRLDTEKVIRTAHSLKKLYQDVQYLNVHIDTKIIPNPENSQKKIAVFTVDEGKKVRIRKVNFHGSEQVPFYSYCHLIFTRPMWLLSTTDDSGKVDEIMLEQDKHRIEYFYQDQGFLMAKVSGIEIEPVDEGFRDVTFYIREGHKFKIRYLNVECSDEEFTDKDLAKYIAFDEGDTYSRTKIVDSINNLKSALGEYGFIFADVYPQLKPLEDQNLVDVSFIVEKSHKLFANNINIVGNNITRDKVIRRQVTFEEGDLITSQKLEMSKLNVEYLSYFERGSVNWKINKVTETLADLTLSVHEARTGHLNFNMTYGADRGSANDSLKFGLDLGKSNIGGLGFDANAIVQASPKSFQRGEFRIFDPYFLDNRISIGFSTYIKRDEYEQWGYLQTRPVEKLWGISSQVGFTLDSIDPKLHWLTEIGTEHVSYNNHNLIVEGISSDVFQDIVKLRFIEGTINWLSFTLLKDTRNHKVYPNQGYRLELSSKFALPFVNQTFSFYKFELEGSWYTPIIGPDSLVLTLHGRGSIIDRFQSDKSIPYKELFQMGGQGTVRGFLWGGVGPVWAPTNAPLGSKRAIQFNAELVFPLVPDYSMKGHFFYDAGAGWRTVVDGIPEDSQRENIKRNNFEMRHSVGFGLNLMQPVPAKIDWGYKLDRKKKEGESASEFHLSMNYAW